MDCVVWPSNSLYLQGCLQTFESILAMSPLHGGHVQLPVQHGQTVATALVKHRRQLEDHLMNARLDVTTPVSLTFDRASLQHQGDKRKLMHPCLFVGALAHEGIFWENSTPCTTGQIGPCRLIRVQDMIGYDADTRPGAAARLEQQLS